MVKLESNQEPRLRSSDTCLMSVAPTRTVLITFFCFVFQLFSLMDKSQDGKLTVAELNSLPGEVSLSLFRHSRCRQLADKATVGSRQEHSKVAIFYQIVLNMYIND